MLKNIHKFLDIKTIFKKSATIIKKVVTMHKINVIQCFSGAHFLAGYPGACSNLHGHNWKVRVQLVSKGTNELGIAIDFKVVKEKLSNLIQKLDHKYLNDLEWFSERNPTSENIGILIYNELQKAFKEDGVTVSEVEVWESDNTSVIYCSE